MTYWPKAIKKCGEENEDSLLDEIKHWEEKTSCMGYLGHFGLPQEAAETVIKNEEWIGEHLPL